MNEKTSKKVASAAGKILRNPKSSKEDKQIAASALTQAETKVENRLTMFNGKLQELFSLLREVSEMSRRSDSPVKQILFKANKKNGNTKTNIQYWK